MIFNPNAYLTVFLSYDEPNADEHYRHLLSIQPNSQRIHGVKGSNTAHKMVANLGHDLGYDRVIIVDGDVRINSDFYSQRIELSDDLDWSTFVLSWSGYNSVNGTSYGNGGIKSWPVSRLLNQQTHENSVDTRTKIDFAFTDYLQLNSIGGQVEVNDSALQAFRAGYREGTKLCLNSGELTCGIKQLDWRNYDRLWSWMHVGMDQPNGIWAIYAARLGAYRTLNGLHDFNLIQDFDYLNQLFSELDPELKLLEESNRLGQLLGDARIINVLSYQDSKFYRQQYLHPQRSPQLFLKNQPTIEYDIISTDTDYHSELSMKRACAEGTTDYIWYLDARADTSEFDFLFRPEFYAPAKIYQWPGVKLLPRLPVMRMRGDLL